MLFNLEIWPSRSSLPIIFSGADQLGGGEMMTFCRISYVHTTKAALRYHRIRASRPNHGLLAFPNQNQNNFWRLSGMVGNVGTSF